MKGAHESCEIHEAELREVMRQREALADALEGSVTVHAEDGTCGPESGFKAEGEDEWCDWCVAARAALRAAGRLP